MHLLRSIVLILLMAISLIIVMLLSSCDNYYKLCSDDCIMYNHLTGPGTYDLPCSDNVTFMVAHLTDGILLDSYRLQYNSSSPLMLYQSLPCPIAMHEPIYPAVESVGESKVSESIKFSLEKDLSSIASVDLYIQLTKINPSDFVPADFIPITNDPSLKRASWTINAGRFRKTKFPDETNPNTEISDTDDISLQTCFRLTSGLISFITYKFSVTNKAGSIIPFEEMDITFALQDYDQYMSDLAPIPAPVYVQGNSDQVVDILFIPAKFPGETSLGEQFKTDFNGNCKEIIRDDIFNDPTVRYWRKQFNFWIHKAEGRVINFNDYDGQCHEVPEIPEFIDVSGLLHNNDNAREQRDFACNGTFSAYVKEGRIVLHEMGHAAFKLEDEYPADGNCEEKVNHFPNNWEKKNRARNDATYRHKTRNDATRLKM